MKSRQEYIDILRESTAMLKQRYGIPSLRLFGSVARNEHHEGSDVDIFIYVPMKFYDATAASQLLEEQLGCKVDLICKHRNMQEFFKKQIERDGIDIFPSA